MCPRGIQDLDKPKLFMYSEIQGSALIEKSAFIIGEKPEVPESILVVAAVVNLDAK